MPRPEETFQAITFISRDDVDVQVGDALADAVIDGDEGSFGFEGALDGGFQFLHGLKQRAHLGGRQIRQGGDVCRRDQQNMAGEERTVIEERDGMVAAPDDLGWNFARSNVAK